MKGNRTAKRIFLSLVIAILASFGTAALADNAEVSERDALEQGVVLYEKMNDASLDVPKALIDTGCDEIFAKAASLGFVSLDEYESVTYDKYIRKQDFMNILYKIIVSYNPDYAIDADEAEEILNDCYDNAYLADENRIPYAFMIKTGIVADKLSSAPNAELKWDGCAFLVDKVYSYFVAKESVTVGGLEIKIGDNIASVTDAWGEPDRVDETDYTYDWYVYNSDYGKFVMVGVDGGRICAFFTNCHSFSYNGVSNGDDYAKLFNVADNNIRIFTDSDGAVDAIMYNPSQKGKNTSAKVKAARAAELLDIINANRAKHGKSVYTEDSNLHSEAYLASLENVDPTSQSVITDESGYDIFSVYSHLLKKDSDVLSGGSPLSRAVGVAVTVDKDNGYDVSAAIVTNENVPAGLGLQNTAETEDGEQEEIPGLDEITTPVITSPAVEETYEGSEDITVSLAIRAAEQYHIEVFDYEKDEYVVNKYIRTNETDFTLPSELFTSGRDYTIIVSSIDEETGIALPSEPILISYGSQYENGVSITSPAADTETDEDCIAITWDSDIYSDFYIDLYAPGGGLVVSRVVEGEKEALIRGVDPGTYYLYVTALRRGTIIEKAQDYVTFTVKNPEPVINEIILDRDEVYDFVYEDKALGVLYFYDEDLVEVGERGETVTKKKIIQKQVKATKGYRRLASYMNKPKSTTGSPFISINGSTDTGNAIVAEAEKYLGVPYVWGGTSPSGFDCSGLVQYILNSLGIDVFRVAEDQFTNGVAVNRDELMPGDLVFFENNGYIHHVGIYAGDNMMIHAPRTDDVVKYTSLDNEYYQREYAGARRVY